MAISLKKETQIREISPVHLLDEEEAVRQFCPPRSSMIEIEVKQADKDLLPAIKEAPTNTPNVEKGKTSMSKSDWFEIIIKTIFSSAAIGGLIAFVYFFFRDYFSLLR